MKGRSPRLIQLRNEYLIKRYYFWYDIQRRRIDDTINILSESEVFLEQDYVMRIVRENTDLLKQLRNAQPSAEALQSFTFQAETPQLVTGNLFASVS